MWFVVDADGMVRCDAIARGEGGKVEMRMWMRWESDAMRCVESEWSEAWRQLSFAMLLVSWHGDGYGDGLGLRRGGMRKSIYEGADARWGWREDESYYCYCSVRDILWGLVYCTTYCTGRAGIWITYCRCRLLDFVFV